MNIMEEHPSTSTCGRCGHPKNTFQTIKFADIFTHLHAHEGQGECQCGDLPPPPQNHHHYQNGTGNIIVKGEPSGSSGVPVIQHHTHAHNQYLTHGSHHQIHQQQEQHPAFILPDFHHELDRHQHLQQQHLFVNNEFDTHPHLQQQQLQQQQSHPSPQLPPNYAPPTTYLTVGGQANGGLSTETKVPISVLVQQPSHPVGNVGVITKNQNKDVGGGGVGVTATPQPQPPKPPRIPCSLCKKTFVNEKMIKAHMERVHEKKSRFVCEICGAAFSYRGSLDSHLCSHTTNPTTTFDCPTCGQKFKQKSNLCQHMKHHSEENPKKFLCPHCPSGFSKRANLRYHIRRIHPGAEGGGPAEIIPPRIIPPPSQLPQNSQHPTTISSTGSNKRKKDKSQSKDNGNGQFKCEECGRSFLFKNNLKAHLRTHSKEKKYSCVECEKSFMYKESLKNHMLLHSNELPYSCEICGKQFRDRSNRRKHVKNVHKYLLLNNNNAGESGVGGSSESLSGGSGVGATGVVASIGRDPLSNTATPPPKKKKANKKTNPPPAPVAQMTNVIKKTRKRVKKVVPPPVTGITVPTTSTTSVIVSNSLVTGHGTGAPAEVDRKIIMSPGPRMPEFQSLHPPPLGSNVIMKTPTTTTSQMQNVIVYPNPINNKSVISNGGSFHHFAPSELQSSQQPHQVSTVSMNDIKQEFASSTPTSNGRGGFQHFTLSRGIITASSAVTNNVHYNYEPQSEYWNDPSNSTQTQAISHHEPYVEEEIQSPHQYATTSSNIVYSSSATAAIQHSSSNMQNNSLQNNSNAGSDPNVEHLDLISQNGSAFFYKDLSQFDFSYL